MPEVPIIWKPSRGWAALAGLELVRFAVQDGLCMAGRALVAISLVIFCGELRVLLPT